MNECGKRGSFETESGECVESCPEGYYGDFQTALCSKCSEHCKSCYG